MRRGHHRPPCRRLRGALPLSALALALLLLASLRPASAADAGAPPLAVDPPGPGEPSPSPSPDPGGQGYPSIECPYAPVVLKASEAPGGCGGGGLLARADQLYSINMIADVQPSPGSSWGVVVDPDPKTTKLMPGTDTHFLSHIEWTLPPPAGGGGSGKKLLSRGGGGARSLRGSGGIPMADCSTDVRVVDDCPAPAPPDTVACAGAPSPAAVGAPQAPPAISAALALPPAGARRVGAGTCEGVAIAESQLYTTSSGNPAQSVTPPVPAILGPGRHVFTVVARGGVSSCQAVVTVAPCRPACRANASVGNAPGSCAAAGPMPAGGVIAPETLGAGALGAYVASSSGSPTQATLANKKSAKLSVVYPGGVASLPTAKACRVAVADTEPPSLYAVPAAAQGAASHGETAPLRARVCTYPRRAANTKACVLATAGFGASDNCPLPTARSGRIAVRVNGCLPADPVAAATAWPTATDGYCSTSKSRSVCVDVAGLASSGGWREARGAVQAGDAAGNASPQGEQGQLLVRAYASAAAAAAAGETGCVAGNTS